MPTPKITPTPTSRVSGVDLTVPDGLLKTAPFDAGEGDAAMFSRLRWLKAQAERGGDKNDVAIVLVEACVEEGIRTKHRIVAVLKAIGCNAGHVGIILDRGTGTSPTHHRWSRRGNGQYSLLAAGAAAILP